MNGMSIEQLLQTEQLSTLTSVSNNQWNELVCVLYKVTLIFASYCLGNNSYNERTTVYSSLEYTYFPDAFFTILQNLLLLMYMCCTIVAKLTNIPGTVHI
jgi:hypothetical protein